MTFQQTAIPTTARQKKPSTAVNLEKQKDETEQLIESCLAGKKQAQAGLYSKYYNLVFAVCLRYTHDKPEAKSLVNLTFLKVFNNLQKLASGSSFIAWIKRIAINTCIDEIRKQHKTSEYISSMADLPDEAVDETLIDKIDAEHILTIIQKIAPVSRTVFCLYILDGYKHAEIAEMLNMAEATSRWHLSNAKKELQVLLKNYQF